MHPNWNKWLFGHLSDSDFLSWCHFNFDDCKHGNFRMLWVVFIKMRTTVHWFVIPAHAHVALFTVYKLETKYFSTFKMKLPKMAFKIWDYINCRFNKVMDEHSIWHTKALKSLFIYCLYLIYLLCVSYCAFFLKYFSSCWETSHCPQRFKK